GQNTPGVGPDGQFIGRVGADKRKDLGRTDLLDPREIGTKFSYGQGQTGPGFPVGPGYKGVEFLDGPQSAGFSSGPRPGGAGFPDGNDQEDSGTKTGVDRKPSKLGTPKGKRKGDAGGANNNEGTSTDGGNSKGNRFSNNGVPSTKKGTPGKQGPFSGDLQRTNYNASRKGIPDLKRKPSLGRNSVSSDKSKLDFCDNLPGYFSMTPDRKKKSGAARTQFQSPFSVIYPSSGECPPGTVRTKDGFFAIPKSKPRSKLDNIRNSNQNCDEFTSTKKKNICDSGTQVLCVPTKKSFQKGKTSVTDRKLIRAGISQKPQLRKSKDTKLMDELKNEALRHRTLETRHCFQPRPMSKRKGCTGVSTESVNELMDFNLATLPMSEESFQRLRSYLDKYLRDYAKLLTEVREQDVLRLCSVPYRRKEYLSEPPREFYPVASSSQGYGYSPNNSICDNRSTYPCQTQSCVATTSSSGCSKCPNQYAAYRIFSVDKVVLNNSPTLSDWNVGKDDKNDSTNEEFDRAGEMTLKALQFSRLKCSNPQRTKESLLLQLNRITGEFEEGIDPENRDTAINRAINSILKDLSALDHANNCTFSKENNPIKEVHDIELSDCPDDNSCNVTKINSCCSSATMTPDISSTDLMNLKDITWGKRFNENQPSQAQNSSSIDLALPSCSYSIPVIDEDSAILDSASSNLLSDVTVDQAVVNSDGSVPGSSTELILNPPSVATLESDSTPDAFINKPFKSNLKSKKINPEVTKTRSVRFSEPVVQDSWIPGDDLFDKQRNNSNGNPCGQRQKPYYVAMFGQTRSQATPGESALAVSSTRVSSSDCNIQF
ncbi:unnamed protein product, partial [Allacma fusca]